MSTFYPSISFSWTIHLELAFGASDGKAVIPPLEQKPPIPCQMYALTLHPLAPCHRAAGHTGPGEGCHWGSGTQGDFN